jgi:ADP-ribosylglycohydrolase
VGLRMEILERASGCLYGVAIADALGAPSTFMSPAQIKRRYGWIEDFVTPPSSGVHGELQQGRFTDDTELTVLLAQSIIEAGRVSASAFSRLLIKWTESRNILQTTIIGPSTRKALENLISGMPPHLSGRNGTTNGCAMRISPVAIFDVGASEEQALRDVEEACMPTHCTRIAISGAAAVCIAVKRALRETGIEQIIEGAVGAAAHPVCSVCDGRRVLLHRRIRKAISIAAQANDDEHLLLSLYSFIRKKRKALTEDAVPVALAIFYYAKGDFNRTAVLCANLGADCDTIGAIAGGIAGAFSGLKGIRESWVQEISKNGVDFTAIAEGLLNARK